MAGPAVIAEIISSFGLDAPPEPLDEVVLRIVGESILSGEEYRKIRLPFICLRFNKSY